MPARPSSSSARVIAPLALAICAVALVAILLTSGSDDGGPRAGGTSSAERRTTQRTSTTPPERRRREADVYTVKTDDTLGSIAEMTGVPVERLQALNPDLDPQALVSGQKIKLRE